MDIKIRTTIRRREQFIQCNTDGVKGRVFVQWVGSNLPDPENIIVTNGGIKATFKDVCLNVTDELHIFSADNSLEEVVADTVSSYSRLSPNAKSFSRWLFIFALSTIVGGFLIFADRKLNDGKFGAWWKSVSVFGVADAIEETTENVDGKILTNESPIYKLKAIHELEKEFGVSYKALFHYVGNGVHVMKDFARNENNDILILSFEMATDYCDERGARLPSEAELDKYLPGKVAGVIDFVLPINANNSMAEWTRDTLDGDHYAAYMKSDKTRIEHSKVINGKVGADEDDSRLAFRCILYSETFEGAE